MDEPRLAGVVLRGSLLYAPLGTSFSRWSPNLKNLLKGKQFGLPAQKCWLLWLPENFEFAEQILPQRREVRGETEAQLLCFLWSQRGTRWLVRNRLSEPQCPHVWARVWDWVMLLERPSMMLRLKPRRKLSETTAHCHLHTHLLLKWIQSLQLKAEFPSWTQWEWSAFRMLNSPGFRGHPRWKELYLQEDAWGPLTKTFLKGGGFWSRKLGNAGVAKCSPDDVESAGPRPTVLELGHKGSNRRFTIPTTLMPEIWIKLE